MKNVKFVIKNWNIDESHCTIKYSMAVTYFTKCEKQDWTMPYSNVLSKY
jgi:hypothetical protein